MRDLTTALIEELEENHEVSDGTLRELEVIDEQVNYHTVTVNPQEAKRKIVGKCAKHGIEETNEIRKALNSVMPTKPEHRRENNEAEA